MHIIIILTCLMVALTILKCLSTEPIFKKSFKPLVPSETYTHSDHIDDEDRDQYVVFWKLLPNDEIQFEVHCNTTGWVGLGISANGGMKGKLKHLYLS